MARRPAIARRLGRQAHLATGVLVRPNHLAADFARAADVHGQARGLAGAQFDLGRALPRRVVAVEEPDPVLSVRTGIDPDVPVGRAPALPARRAQVHVGRYAVLGHVDFEHRGTFHLEGRFRRRAGRHVHVEPLGAQPGRAHVEGGHAGRHAMQLEAAVRQIARPIVRFLADRARVRTAEPDDFDFEFLYRFSGPGIAHRPPQRSDIRNGQMQVRRIQRHVAENPVAGGLEPNRKRGRTDAVEPPQAKRPLLVGPIGPVRPAGNIRIHPDVLEGPAGRVRDAPGNREIVGRPHHELEGFRRAARSQIEPAAVHGILLEVALFGSHLDLMHARREARDREPALGIGRLGRHSITEQGRIAFRRTPEPHRRKSDEPVGNRPTGGIDDSARDGQGRNEFEIPVPVRPDARILVAVHGGVAVGAHVQPVVARPRAQAKPTVRIRLSFGRPLARIFRLRLVQFQPGARDGLPRGIDDASRNIGRNRADERMRHPYGHERTDERRHG